MPATLHKDMVVADVIPNPPRTRLIRDAEARGATVLDGLGMLVQQGVISVRHWTGVDADPAVMRHALAAIFAWRKKTVPGLVSQGRIFSL